MLQNITQIESLSAVPDTYELFNRPFQNNYSIVFANRWNNKEMAGKGNDKIFFGLNKANLNLQKYIEICLDELESINSSPHRESVGELRRVYEIWSKFTKQGNQFMTYEPARVLIEGFEMIGYPFFQRLEEKKIIKEAFIDLVPDEVKSMVRICLVINFEHLTPFFCSFAEKFTHYRDLFGLIDRVEIAKENFFAEATTRIDFPTFNININPCVTTDIRCPEVSAIMDIVRELMIYRYPVEFGGDYYSKFADNSFICQGFSNYKRFLDLIRQLDMVYDRDSGYAFRLGQGMNVQQ